MQSADAVTPAPTYGTPASSSRPCTVPSSPNGPWRTGNTTSTSASAPVTERSGRRAVSVARTSSLLGRLGGSSSGRGADVGGPRAQRPSRSISTGITSQPASASAAATLRPEATEISCSLERPPETTATRRLKEEAALARPASS